MNEKQVALDQILALIAEVAPSGQPLQTPTQDTVANAYTAFRFIHEVFYQEALAAKEAADD